MLSRDKCTSTVSPQYQRGLLFFGHASRKAHGDKAFRDPTI
jgi:hypothetical protein